ncbi:hypothetical protein S7711_10817 [Stachybotrys chartarum IBT 7711]|uniref:LysM domain-containing protein n=1 Tax=Stachybotrys chartarum (strain CBS 109288 / IBT 7711) TaxID=1280523 RepID=A0A084B6Q0_STACB|nr:hypothetical protein S7711_10817 [Stachybotrys chartarum IBT 7711]KFA56669.1 hypothetical protein S40293_11047 [Stachybotrys chartarum IBT 40293]KFA81815.1 hypothetical protein S40288_11588 [Stachybotrys chartarum IBT 40288]
MRPICIATLAAFLGFGAAQYTVDPPTTAAPDTILDCTYWHVALANDTCEVVNEYPWLTLEEFYTYNPSLPEGCQFVVGNSYCVEQNWDIPPQSPSPTTTLVTSTMSATPTATPSTPAEWCASEAGGYVRYCPRCLYRCEDSAVFGQCFYSVFLTINYYDSQCWQHGGIDCANQAVDRVCPQT